MRVFNFDDPGFPYALLAILLGLRLAVFAVERYLTARSEPVPAGPALVPDEALATLAPDATPDGELGASAPATPAAADDGGSTLRLFNELLDSGIIAVALVFFLIRPFILQAFYIPSGSMYPTLKEGDKVLAAKYTYHVREPRGGDIIVFHAPREALEMHNDRYDPLHPTDYVKRVVGVPGDRIRIVNGVGVYVNEKLLKEPYVAAMPDYTYPVTENGDLTPLDSAVRDKLLPHIKNWELVVPKGSLFVLGDNRTMSLDSHRWGLLARKAVVGKVVCIFWPPKRMGMVH